MLQSPVPHAEAILSNKHAGLSWSMGISTLLSLIWYIFGACISLQNWLKPRNDGYKHLLGTKQG